MSDTYNYYSVRIPKPELPGELKHIAHIETSRGDFNVYMADSIDSVVICHNDQWYVQPDNYAFDSIAQILKIASANLDLVDETVWKILPDGSKIEMDPRCADEFPGAYWWWVQRHLSVLYCKLTIREKKF